MEKFIEKADVLIEALPYIKRFYGKEVVIKFGGSLMLEQANMKRVLEDIVFMKYVGMKPVVIHGGGPAISDAMREKGLTPTFIDGLRVTDRKTMDIVEDVLVHKINKQIVQMLNDMQGNAEGLSGCDGQLIVVEKYMPERKNKVDEREGKLDLGYVGKVKKINSLKIEEIKSKGKIPVIAPIGIGPDGLSYNINGDEVAGEIAAAIKAEKLVFLTNIIGIMRDPADSTSLYPTLSCADAKDLIDRKIVQGGMIPKLKSCVKALQNGAYKAHIIDGRIEHSLLLEMFTTKGIGTELVK